MKKVVTVLLFQIKPEKITEAIQKTLKLNIYQNDYFEM